MVQPGGARPTESSAIVSLVLGIAGIFVLPLILSVPAIIVGKSAQRKIAASGDTLGGAELAKAGVVTGWIGVGLAVLGMIIFVIFVLGALTAANLQA